MRTGALSTACRLLLGGALVVPLSGATAVAAADSSAGAGCARQFDEAQRIDMESFRDGHHPDAITVFASGARRVGIDAIMAALASHFANREAIWAWTELYRVVDGCRSGFILYDTTYDIPSIGFHQHALTGVTYTHVGDKWLASPTRERSSPSPRSRDWFPPHGPIERERGPAGRTFLSHGKTRPAFPRQGNRGLTGRPSSLLGPWGGNLCGCPGRER
jgi:hypothetical protein